MTSTQRKWLLGGGVVLGVLLLAGGAQALSPSSVTSRDVDALANMLIAETSFSAAPNEMAQIVFIAVNRADRWGVPIYSVVAGPQPKAGTNPWNDSALYKARLAKARTQNEDRWQAARAFVQEVLNGSYRNLGFTKFVHPGGMPVPPCVRRSSSCCVEAQTVAGTRCIPVWVTNGKTVGKGLFA